MSPEEKLMAGKTQKERSAFSKNPPKPRCEICGSKRLKLGKDGLCCVCRDERNRISEYRKGERDG